MTLNPAAQPPPDPLAGARKHAFVAHPRAGTDRDSNRATGVDSIPETVGPGPSQPSAFESGDDLAALTHLAMLALGAAGATVTDLGGATIVSTSAAARPGGTGLTGRAEREPPGRPAGDLASRVTATRPIRDPSGAVVAELAIWDEAPRSLSPVQVEMLNLFAGLLGSWLRQDAVSDLLLPSSLDESPAAALDAALAEFASDLVHDLKSPLTAIIGFAEILATRPSVAGDESATRSAARISTAARKMASQLDEAAALATRPAASSSRLRG